jgi:hypothetical protein
MFETNEVSFKIVAQSHHAFKICLTAGFPQLLLPHGNEVCERAAHGRCRPGVMNKKHVKLQDLYIFESTLTSS